MSDKPDPDRSAKSEPDEAAPRQPDQPGIQAPVGDGAPLDPAAEQTLWAGRSHWAYFLGTLACGLLAIVVSTCLCYALRGHGVSLLHWLGLTLVFALLTAGRVAWLVLGRSYRLTDQRLFIIRGVLSQTIDQTELIRVDDVRIRRSFAERLLGLGSVEIISTDRSDQALDIMGICSPNTVAEYIRTHMRNLRRKSLFIESL
ncbi:MAG: PH domain-containing protein [bacterium]|nr:PH domain-containing protein [bacterium]